MRHGARGGRGDPLCPRDEDGRWAPPWNVRDGGQGRLLYSLSQTGAMQGIIHSGR